MKYRGRTEIVADILMAAKEGIAKTKLMYTTFISFNQLKEYSAVLEEKGLLIFDQTSVSFRTTPKGREYLDMVYKLNEISGFEIVGGSQFSAKARLPTLI